MTCGFLGYFFVLTWIWNLLLGVSESAVIRLLVHCKSVRKAHRTVEEEGWPMVVNEGERASKR